MHHSRAQRANGWARDRRPDTMTTMSRRRPGSTGANDAAPDPGHGCADPARCTQPFCARPAHVNLVAPHETRVVIGRLPSWPIGPDALFAWLNARITRKQLLGIASTDPFGAHQHFPILARIRVSGRVPPHLEFDPGEALRLTRWGAGPDTDHLARAWCCALMAIAPGDDSDDLPEVAAQLIESCLALGDDAPELAEQLLAWRAISEDPAIAPLLADDEVHADPVALLALLLLRAAADPADARLPDLISALANAFTESDDPPRQTTTASAELWRSLVDRILAPLCPTNAELDRLVTALRGHFPDGSGSPGQR